MNSNELNENDLETSFSNLSRENSVEPSYPPQTPSPSATGYSIYERTISSGGCEITVEESEPPETICSTKEHIITVSKNSTEYIYELTYLATDHFVNRYISLLTRCPLMAPSEMSTFPSRGGRLMKKISLDLSNGTLVNKDFTTEDIKKNIVKQLRFLIKVIVQLDLLLVKPIEELCYDNNGNLMVGKIELSDNTDENVALHLLCVDKTYEKSVELWEKEGRTDLKNAWESGLKDERMAFLRSLSDKTFKLFVIDIHDFNSAEISFIGKTELRVKIVLSKVEYIIIVKEEISDKGVTYTANFLNYFVVLY
ncbi:hypothetical protein MHBO_000042 [Bonamia ostreae]|uniref:Uncharacterized protein n=1 Tax=Bonamia ostreae TaxID=126728 RepID=A0ABV2AFI2_9EUKA